MESFTGILVTRIDPQGRLVLPRPFREALHRITGDQLHWQSTERGALLIPAPEVDALAQKIRQSHGDAWYTDPALIDDLEEAFSAMDTLSMDVQFRVKIPEKAASRLGDKVQVIGLGRVLEVRPLPGETAPEKQRGS